MYPKDGKWDDESFDTSPWTGTNDYYGNWWGGNLRGVKDHPIDLGKYQSQLVYSPHDYGPLVYEQTWFSGDFITADDETAQKILYEECWRDNWAFIMEDGISPLFMGEWGGLTEGNDKLLDLNLKYLRCMRDYILENKYNLHHTLWCINIDSADTGGLFTRDEGTPFEGGRDLKWNDNKYDNYLLPVLWKNEEGKFQGLDHKIPLGKNGVAMPTGSSPVTPTKTPSTSTPTPTATPTPTPTSPVFIKGDLDGNGDVDSIDFALFRNYFLGNIKKLPVEDEVADLNGDGEVNSIDFASMRLYLLGMISEFSS
jgi:hypothetical protein